MEVVDLRDRMDLFEEAVHVYWSEWGSETNYNLYYDAIFHACQTEELIPRFYIALEQERIIGTYALLINDFISRLGFISLGCLPLRPSGISREAAWLEIIGACTRES